MFSAESKSGTRTETVTSETTNPAPRRLLPTDKGDRAQTEDTAKKIADVLTKNPGLFADII